MARYIDINADMGEGYGAYDIGNDAAMLDIISTANLACGFHGGDPSIMAARCGEAKAKKVRIGAHPGFPDIQGFGRRHVDMSFSEVRDLIAYQMGALDGVARLSGYEIAHVKTHGALGHYTGDTEHAAEALIAAVKAYRSDLIVMAMAGTALVEMAEAAGLRVAREIFADRAYEEDGRLMSRKKAGSMIHDADAAAENVAAMVRENAVISSTGKRIPLKSIDSVCTHGDSDNAIAISSRVKARLIEEGFEVAPFAETMA
ncbi:MAG: 5-oxoprolinase subunit PxpA [Pseudomonadota bacterium]